MKYSLGARYRLKGRVPERSSPKQWSEHFTVSEGVLSSAEGKFL